MKLKNFGAALCLCAALSTQIHGANQTGNSTVTLVVGATSALTVTPINFTEPGESGTRMPIAGEYYVSVGASWSWSSNDTAGYKVVVNDAQDAAGVWQLANGANTLDFTLLTNTTLTGTVTTPSPAIPATGGAIPTGITGVSIIAPGAAPADDTARLYYNTALNAANVNSLVYAAVADGQLSAATVFGSYVKTLQINLNENT